MRHTQTILLLVYAILPLGMLAWALFQRRRGRLGPLISLLIAYVACILGAIGLGLLHGYVLGGRVPAAEVARIALVAIGVVCVVMLLDRGLLTGIFSLGRVRLDAVGRPLRAQRWRAMGLLGLQRLLMVALVMPYVVTLLVVYRPKVHHPGDPQSLQNLAFIHADLRTHDGLQLAGWWMPAQDKPPYAPPELAAHWGRQSVIVCHGLGAGRHATLELAHALTQRGYNVLAFDFRAHGHSDGNFTSFGDRERHDVLAAIAWIDANHPSAAERLFGIGLNTGAAALVAAAVEPGGERLDALVLCEPFASTTQLTRLTLDQALPAPLARVVQWLGVPMAQLHSGTFPSAFAPAELAADIWPRPVLVIHGRGQTFVPLTEEMDFAGRLLQPRQRFWPSDRDRSGPTRASAPQGETEVMGEMLRTWLGAQEPIWHDPGVFYRMLRFMQNAEPLQVL